MADARLDALKSKTEEPESTISKKVEEKGEEEKAELIVRIVKDVKDNYEKTKLVDEDIDALVKELEKIKVVEEPKKKTGTEEAKEVLDEVMKAEKE